MPVSAIKEKQYAEEICDTFSLLNTFLKYFSMDCDSKRNTENKCLSVFKTVLPAVVLGGINVFTLYYKIMYIYPTILASIKYTDAVQIICDLLQYLVDLFYVYRYGSHVFMEYITNYAIIDNLIGIVYYDQIKRRFKKLSILFGVTWIVTSLCDYSAWTLNYGIISASVFAPSYIYLLLKIFTNVDLSLHMMHVESRLRSMGDVIQACYKGSNKANIREILFKRNCFFSEIGLEATEFDAGVNSPGLNTYDPYLYSDKMKYLKSCYLLLIEQVKYINNVLGMRILLNSASLLVDMVRFINLAVRLFVGSQHTDDKYFPSIATSMRFYICGAILISLVDFAEKAYRQRERMISVLDNLLVIGSLNPELASELKEIRDLVQARPVIFHMANFVQINYSFLVSMASVVSTYTIILLQSSN